MQSALHAARLPSAEPRCRVIAVPPPEEQMRPTGPGMKSSPVGAAVGTDVGAVVGPVGAAVGESVGAVGAVVGDGVGSVRTK